MMMGDIDNNRQDIELFNDRMIKVEELVQSQAVSMARIDVNIEHIRGAVEKMAGQ